MFAAASVAIGQSDTGVWPVYNVKDGMRDTVNRNVLQGFGDGSNSSEIVAGMHEGLDILASGKGGEEVDVARAGIVAEKYNGQTGGGDNGFISVLVQVGSKDDGMTPIYETDVYAHLTNMLDVAVGATVAQGDQLGNISSTVTGFKSGSCHLHYGVYSGARTHDGAMVGDGGITTSKFSVDGLLNALARFKDAKDRDPGGVRPELADTDNNGKSLVVTRMGTTTALDSKTINGGVDLIGDLRDNMNANFLGASGVYRSGYYIKADFEGSHDVRTKDSPYILAQFDDAFFANGGNELPDNLNKSIYATDASYLVTTDNKVAGFNNTVFPLTRNYILTHTKGNDGSVANIDASQFWNTKASDDQRADTAALANMSDGKDAAKNADARFKDGDYVVHVIAGDLVGTQDLVAGKVRVDNFKQVAEPEKGAAAPLPNPGILLPLSNSLTPFAAGYEPTDPESATNDFKFNLGDLVGVAGDEYYPNLTMPVYITPHRSSWLDGDLFGGVLAGWVRSDSLGAVSSTFTNYVADHIGQFDMIIDYDRNGRFSATLDGLTGFSVVPEPSALLLAILGIVAVSATSVTRRAIVPPILLPTTIPDNLSR
jgi:hypothetical protein